MLAFDTREDFLNSRMGKLGASDAPIIMGVSPYCTPYKLWQQKLGLIEPNEMKPHMQAGLDIENDARDYFYKITGKKVYPYQIQHKNITYMIASLDGISEGGDTILEIKKPSKKDHEFSKKNNKPPEKYWPQLQHQLECANLNECFYLSFYDNDPILLSVDRDQNYIDNLLGKEAEFFKCMKELEAPELIEADYIIRTDTEWTNFCMEFREYQEKIKDLERKMEDSKKKLINIAGGENCKGSGVSVCQVVRKGNIDYKIIPQLEGIDLEKYRKDATKYWKVNAGKV